MELNKTYQINCLEGLKQLESNSIDLVFFDPIYNAKKNYGIYKDNLPESEYFNFMKKVIEESNRVSKRGIGIYVDSWRFKLYYQKLFPDSNLPIIIWKKSPSFRDEYNVLATSHFILFNCKALIRVKNLWPDIHPGSDGFYFNMDKWEKKFDHPAQTSLKATMRFIKHFSKEGELILDNFMGTGTTSEACIRLNRNYIGFEINPDYILIEKERIKKIQKSTLDKYF